MNLKIKRTIECPNPEFGGTQDAEDCLNCDLNRGISIAGEEMSCGYGDEPE